ncbi:uncharacterized protein LOC114739609 [Neltuma alba]|uniref:uncharacterized protein LOC114739609 n=1 Tax=Neltuma alba TaxID=207710 RepID=UPI0010A40AFA|nr:uncharacterized protein LOC114739609 [Prosopis alba]
MRQPLFALEEVICNLETLALNNEDASMILQGQFSRKHFNKLKSLRLANFKDDDATFPYWVLQNITVNDLLIEWSSFREIFQEEIPIDDKRKSKTGARLKALTLWHLDDLQHICKEGFRIDPVLGVLEDLLVHDCSNLRHLAPSSGTFHHLTHLEVVNCNGLVHLITSSTARSLVKLTTMKITKCNSLEQVVAEKREEFEDEIAFRSLEILKLKCLPMIKRFCSSNCFLIFPLLKEVVIEHCPRMNTFSAGRDTSTPKLRKISSKEEDGNVYWEGDLNKTINKMFADKVAFSRCKYLELSEYPELKQLWYGQVGQKIFCNLKHLTVHKCTFLTNVIFTSNLLQLLYTLEEVEVTECDSLEAVFDVKVLDDKEMHPNKASQLKKLTLSGLPNLKYIWTKDFPKALGLENLQVVHVAKCQNLKYVFSPSLCQDLRQLEELNIESCGVEQIVANEEGLEELKFYFPLLRIFRLIRLTQLNDFYPKRYTLECPSLKVLNVGRCEALQIFAFGNLDYQELRGACVDLPIQQALFHIGKVSENLEELSLNEKDAMRILNGSYEKTLFQRTEKLRLQYFQETPVKFLNELLERFPSATTLQVRWSSFETLFHTAEIGHFNIKKPTQIKKLWLYQLEQLQHIWNDDSASDTLVPHLEDLTIIECSRLRRLAPPLTSFASLTTLEVEDCNGLMYFVTPFTAKSLVHLTSLTVTNCGMLEEIVMTNEVGSEEEIIFESLKDLELTCLSCFKSFCSGKHTFIFPSLVKLKVTECHKMQNFSSGTIIAPFLKLVEVENGRKRWKGDLNTTIKHLFTDKAIREGQSSDIIESSQIHQMTRSTSEASSFEEQVGQSKPNQITNTGKQETRKLPSQSCDREQNEQASSGMERPLAHVTQNASSPSTNQDTEESQDAETESSMSLSRPATTFNDKESLAEGTQGIGENIERPLVEAAKIAPSPTGVYDAEVNETVEKPLIQTIQKAQRPTTVQDIEGPHESKTCPREHLFNQPETFITSDDKETIGTHKIHDTMDKSLIQADQDAEKHVTAQNKAIDPSPSKAPGTMTSPILELNAYSDRWLIDISKQNLPYLEAGLKRHPQVLDWFNTKRRRAFAALFTEVTSILRTTRRRDLTEDDRNYIRECCTALAAVGFDASWLSYVYGCIESYGDGDELMRKLEETEAKVFTLRNELASAEASLVSLRDEASRLNDFIES